ncbi:MAG TPA: VWA domain-containing protein, partial [Beijerinckiaceae bacterium]
SARIKTKLQMASDGAALMGVQALSKGASVTQMNARVNEYMLAAMAGTPFALPSPPQVSADRTEVCVDAYADVPSVVMQVVGRRAFRVDSASCAKGGGTDYEIAMVLDTTGSMNGGVGGVTKIAALRSSAKAFVDHMYGAAPDRVKISIVPFAASVRLDPTQYRNAAWVDKTGASSWHWKSPLFTRDVTIAGDRFSLYAHLRAIKPAWDWAGCFETLPYPYNVQDTTPSASTPDTLLVPMLAPDEPDAYYKDGSGAWRANPNTYVNNYLDDAGGACSGALPTGTKPADETVRQSRVCKYKGGRADGSGVGPNQHCASDPLMRMTNSDTALKSKIDALVASGNTNVFEGFTWGWRTISPNGPFKDGRGYTTLNNKKVIVLMTDGENVWSGVDNKVNDSQYGPMGYFTTATDRMPPKWGKIDSDAKSRAALDELLRQSCSNARSAGVVIYTIGFSVPGDELDSQAKKLLEDCAGSKSRAYVAADATQLTSAFKDIANGIADLRLAR